MCLPRPRHGDRPENVRLDWFMGREATPEGLLRPVTSMLSGACLVSKSTYTRGRYFPIGMIACFELFCWGFLHAPVDIRIDVAPPSPPWLFGTGGARWARLPLCFTDRRQT